MSTRKRLGADPSRVLTSISDALDQHDDDLGALELVSVSKIQFNPLNPRKVMLDRGAPRSIPADSPHRAQMAQELERLEEMAASIEAVGLMQPIGIYRHGDHFVLVWGERRLLAHILLGRASIPARILRSKPKNVLASQLIENINRSDLSLREKVNGFRKLVEESRLGPEPITSESEFAVRVGLRATTAYTYWTIVNAPDDIDTAIANGRLRSAEDAQRVALLPTRADREAAIAALDGSAIAADSGGFASDVTQTPQTPRPPRGRGRPVTSVALPRISNPQLLRMIAERVTTKQEFARWHEVDWNDLKIAGDVLRQILKQIERRMQATVTK